MKRFFTLLAICVAIIGVAAALMGAHVIEQRRSIFTYDVSMDYAYDFASSEAEIIALDGGSGDYRLPPLNGASGSAFLEVEVGATWLGSYLQPSIRVTSGGASARESLEYGARGKRYVNITSLLSDGRDRTIRVEGKHVRLTSDRVSLIRFPARQIRDKKVLVLAPHPDDAEIAAFGLYSDARDAYVVTITAGDAGGQNYDELYPDKKEHYLKKGQLRTWNSLTVPLLGGVPPDRCVNLGFFDGTLPKMFANRQSTVESVHIGTSDITTFRDQNLSPLASGLSGDTSWDSLVDNLAFILGEVRPDIIVTPYPLIDSHSDHQLTTIALLEAIRSRGLRDGSLFLYTNHLPLNEFYPYGGIGDGITLPPNFDATLTFDSVLSYPLSPARQNDKLLAMEAMNDLRPDTGFRFFRATLRLARRNFMRDLYGQDSSYYRRAVRSNELFFIVDIARIHDPAIFAALQRTAAAADPPEY